MKPDFCRMTACTTALAALFACGLPARPAFAAPGRIPAEAVVTLRHPDGAYGDRRVGTYYSSTRGFSTATYWIEGPKGLILIDTQFLPSAAAEVLDWAEQATGKKVVLAVVLHPNPDKFNGTAVFKKRGVRVITSAQVRALIPSVHEDRKASFYERYKPDYPAAATLPDSFGDKTTEIDAAGTRIKLHVLGPGCSEAHVVVEWEKHLFVGDLVASDAHSWLEIGKTDEWLKRIDELLALEPDFVHPGRGPSGDDRRLTQAAAYLKEVIAAVAAEKPRPLVGDKLDEAAKQAIARIRDKLDQRFSGYRFDIFLDIGLPAEWRRQARIKP